MMSSKLFSNLILLALLRVAKSVQIPQISTIADMGNNGGAGEPSAEISTIDAQLSAYDHRDNSSHEEENSAANDIIEMASKKNCKPWCSKRKEDGTWCWKCNGYADSCGGCQECKDNHCAPADCQAWCAGQFKKKSVKQVCALTACAGCDKCPEPPVIKAASNYVCEVGKNYMGEAQEWSKGNNNGRPWTRAQCANKCNAQKGCRAYILSPEGLCFLKSNIGIVEHNKGATLACRKTNYDPKGFICENGVNYMGQDKETYYGGMKSMADCATKCRKAKWCHVYVYHQGKKDCYIKDKVGRTDHNKRGTESCRDQTVTYSWR